MASAFARLRHEFAQCDGDAIAWRVGVKGAHEFAFRVHDVNVGPVFYNLVFRASSSLMGCPVDPVFRGDRGLRASAHLRIVPTIEERIWFHALLDRAHGKAGYA